ncbi:MAG: hypothetical protein DLM57_19010 [Pseudonocardiales bacterium]|nr:MAG: hypothetical protein DLM57_19010 [Pseudonocardiales bacterium]
MTPPAGADDWVGAEDDWIGVEDGKSREDGKSPEDFPPEAELECTAGDPPWRAASATATTTATSTAAAPAMTAYRRLVGLGGPGPRGTGPDWWVDGGGHRPAGSLHC